MTSVTGICFLRSREINSLEKKSFVADVLQEVEEIIQLNSGWQMVFLWLIDYKMSVSFLRW